VHFGGTPVIPVEERQQHLAEMLARPVVDPTHDAEVDSGYAAVVAHEQIAGVQIAMEEAVAEHLIEERLCCLCEHPVRVVPGSDDRVSFVDPDTADALRREHALAGAHPVHDRDVKAGVAREVFRKLRRRRCLEAEIHLAPDGVGEYRDRLDETQTAQRRYMHFDAFADPEEQVEVAVERRFDAGPQHLDRDLPSLRVHGEVHLRDRGGGDRLLVEAVEQLFQWPAELVLDSRSNVVEREGRQAILQLRQVGCDLLAEQVGPARQSLTQLDERRAGVLERAGELLPGATRLPAHERAQREYQQACRIDAVEDEQGVVPRQDADK
jgi:hypothetical protein